MFPVHALPPVEDEAFLQDTLPPVFPGFFIPRLSDKPQNPILDTLKRDHDDDAAIRTQNLPPEVVIVAADFSALRLESEPLSNDDSLWAKALIQVAGTATRALSWDNLRPLQSKRAAQTGFLSEQGSTTFASVRYLVQPRLYDLDTEVLHVTADVLWRNLKMTVCGISSQLHVWNLISERFVQSGVSNGRSDEKICSSICASFLRIGTLLRRLETFVVALRSRSPKEGPTIHAFAHTMSNVLSFLRESLAVHPLTQELVENGTVSTKLAFYTYYEDIMVALAKLCRRNEDIDPADYIVLESRPQVLLSQQSQKDIIAILAYILTSTSPEYFLHLSRSVGFGKHRPLPQISRVIGDRSDEYTGGTLDDADIAKQLDGLESESADCFPAFFAGLSDTLPAARKSLVLLMAAQPDHPMLKAHSAEDDIRWFWSPSEIDDAFNDRPVRPPSNGDVHKRDDSNKQPFSRPPELAQFGIFDLEPGARIDQSFLGNTSITSSTTNLKTFIQSFPETLPPITPTLPHLTTLVLRPLLDHASKLSGELLSFFLQPSTPLNIRAHMKLLQCYLLLGAPQFKSRLATALFSDNESYDAQTRNPMSLQSFRIRRRNRSSRIDTQSNAWAVGLAPSLLDREMWPPVGADLSFFLRTVIVDSFESGLLEEVDNRLGFAIRDLPTGRGRDRWLNPLCASLDFLYMEYKPPRPLQYQRMFTFLLRLMRVEHAIAAVFRMTRSLDAPLFPTLAASRKRLLHLRFISHSLVSTLCQYVCDTAIGGNFDTFLERLSPHAPPFLHNGEPSGACLMRSSQRQAGDLLRDSLELILEFCILAGQLRRKSLEEYQAAPLLEDLNTRLRKKMSTFTGVVKSMLDSNISTTEQTAHPEGDRYVRKPPGGTQALATLLLRLDTVGDWWA
ncbi:gamma-tubulin complex, DGRIP91/SPC98 component protein [Armillaria novae-zelandiae]|uniref:Spindle pole body component n=1 Tax=Armillaria novae-zelandiae TaxID=153914 RepID=A0AA39P3U8_9AGAR|nr:gamma-tubulin complex, DGRIP91/SPC98 component protein [Armillaria novae-zelandiae]